MKYSVDRFDELYNYTDTNEELIEQRLRNNNISHYRVKTIKSGEMLESEIYPVWNTNPKAGRAPKQKQSRKAQRNLNNKNAVKKVVRLINTNFKPNLDIWVKLGYDDEHLPTTIEEAQKEMQKYIRRVKNYIAKHGLPPLKYIYVTEGGSDTGKRLHHHIVMNFRNRDIAEALWKNELYPQARRLKDSQFKFEGMARYIAKEAKGANQKKWSASRNLERPTITIADSKMTRAKANKIVLGYRDARTEFERIYKGYQFNDMYTQLSEWVSGSYIYVRMRRKQ